MVFVAETESTEMRLSCCRQRPQGSTRSTGRLLPSRMSSVGRMPRCRRRSLLGHVGLEKGMRQLTRALPLSSFLVVALPAMVSSAAPRLVDISGDRIVLGQLVAGLPEQLARLDFGPSPELGHVRTVSGREIRRRVQRAMLDDAKRVWPARLKVRRPAQRISEARLNRLFRVALQAQLPAGAEIRGLLLPGGRRLERGAVHVTVQPITKYRSGRQSVRLGVRGGDGPWHKLLAVVDLRVAAQPNVPVISRGDRVVLAVRMPAVVAQTAAIAQSAGRVGDRVAVTPVGGRKVVYAVVRDANTVEVLP